MDNNDMGDVVVVVRSSVCMGVWYADHCPSLVAAVQSSCQVRMPGCPKVKMGSIVNTMPGSIGNV